MGQKKSRYSSAPPLDLAVLRRITTMTSFLPDEIQYFYYDFLKYTPKAYLTLSDFEKFYQTLFRHGSPEHFAQYAFNAYDTNRDGVVDFEEFITGLYFTTKASPSEKVDWAFDLCDQDRDHYLTLNEMENVIQALYELSDADMARVENYHEAIERVQQSFLTDPDEPTSTEVRSSVGKSDFVNIVQNDPVIMKLIDCRLNISKRASRFENSRSILLKKQLKFQPSMYKSLSDSKLATPYTNDGDED